MVIISGASGGIGLNLLRYYASREAAIGTYFSTEPSSSLGNYEMYRVDVREYESVCRFFALISDKAQRITLINCAGITYNSFAHKSDPIEWKNVVETNLIGTYNVIRAFLPIMRDQGYGRIINFSSVTAQKGTLGTSAYAASKSGLWGLGKALCQENASKHLTINCINLGYCNFGMGIEKVPEDYRDIIKTQIPTGRFCDMDEIILTIEYLRSNEYINGSSIDLNGGLF